MKLVLEILIAAILHPIAVVLMWLDLARRADLDGTKKIVSGVFGIVWGIGPILYCIVGEGKLW